MAACAARRGKLGDLSGPAARPGPHPRRRVFEAWNLWQLDADGRSGEPLLAVKLEERQAHVVRAILTHGWESFDAGSNVIETRPTQKWVRELVGSVDLAGFADAADLEAELATLLHQAVVGISRLALTSLEAPCRRFRSAS